MSRARRWRTVAAALLCLASAAAPDAAAQGGGEQEPAGREPVVRSLEWEGVSALSTGELESYIFTEAPSWKPWVDDPPFSRATLEDDEDRVAALYRRRGYYEAGVRAEVDWDEARESVAITFFVEEGEPVRVTERRIDIPTPAGPAPELLDDLPLEEGDVFTVPDYRAAKEELLARLSNRGFPRASIHGGAEVSVATQTARVDWDVQLGPLVRFGSVRIEGLQQVDEHLIRRGIAFEEGERFSLDALAETRRAVQDVGLFRHILIEPRPAQATGAGDEAPPGAEKTETWPVDVQVDERPPRSVRIGVGWGTEDQLRAQVSWQHRNFLGGARRLELSARYSSLLLAFDTSFEQPWFLVPEMLLRSAASLRRETFPAYDADRLIGEIGVQRPFGEVWSGRAGYRIERNDIEGVSLETRQVLEEPEGTVTLSFFELGVRRDTTDDLFSPEHGTWLDLSLEPAFRAIGSDVGYLKMVAEARGFEPLGPGVLAGRLRIGTIDPLGGDSADAIPLVKRFYSGGSNSVRGFEFQKLGPLDEDEDPIGGTSLLEASLEWRFPIYKKLGGVAFTDAGQVALEPYTWRVDDLFYSAGLGARYGTPIGPIRVDFGYILNAPDELEPWRFHISVGHTF